MSSRVEPAVPPFPAAIQAQLDRLMPAGVPPLALFTTLARDERLFARFMGGGLLDRGHLPLRARELAIDRITARCGSEYEWGVHVALFGARIGLTDAQRAALVGGGPDDPCWSEAEGALLALCDALDATCTVDDALWTRVRAHWSELAIVELILVCGFYRTVSYLTNALRLPLEPFAARFPPPVAAGMPVPGPA